MAWQTPKTDWKIQPVDENGRYNGDWFNVADYDRITGNITALSDLAKELYLSCPIEDMPAQTVSDFPFAYIINTIEENVNSIATNTWKPHNYPGPKIWRSNQATPTVNDLNRVESALLSIYQALQQQKTNRSKLSFQLKGSDF